MSEFTWDPREESVRCSECRELFADDEVVQHGNMRGRRQYICFGCMAKVEAPVPQPVEAAA